MKCILVQKNIPNLAIRSLNDLVAILKIEPQKLFGCAKTAPYLYTIINIPKRSGGYRKINAPQSELKTIQRAILHNVLSHIPLERHIYGFSSGKTIVENANAHANSAYLVNIDIINFFPNVHFRRINQLFLEIGCSQEVAGMLTMLTTLCQGLPQGAPTSPYLATLSLNNLDRRMVILCKKNRLIYTRYYDDITISGGKRTIEIVDTVQEIIESEGHHMHRIPGKFSICGPTDTKNVTGLLLVDGRPQVPNIQQLEHEVRLFRDNLFEMSEHDDPYKIYDVLRGKIAFVVQVNEIIGKQLLEELQKATWLLG